MALEQILERLVTAVEANTAAHTGSSSPKQQESSSSKADKPAAQGVISQEALKAAAVKVMDKHGKPFAKKLIKDVGGADSLPTVKREKFAPLMKAFEKALSAGGAEEEVEDEDEDL